MIKQRFCRFVQFQTIAGKRNIDWPVPTHILTSWRDSEVNVYLHVYSLDVNSRAAYLTLKKTLINPYEKDRSGASSNQRIQAVVDELRDIHKYVYAGKDIVWRMWANEIVAKEPHLYETLVRDPPPANILRFMTLADDNPQATLRNFRRTVSVTSNLSETYSHKTHELKKYVDEATSLQADIAQKSERLRVVFHKIQSLTDGLNNYATANADLLQNMNQSFAQPAESEFSVETFQNIENVNDIDHE